MPFRVQFSSPSQINTNEIKVLTIKVIDLNLKLCLKNLKNLDKYTFVIWKFYVKTEFKAEGFDGILSSKYLELRWMNLNISRL